MRSPLRHAEGLGSAKSGFKHWWAQRVSAVALIPLTVWILGWLLALAGSDYSTFTLWLQSPVTTILMILFLIALFCHAALGLQVVIEDYIYADWVKIPTVVTIHFMCFALAVAGIIATLRIALDG
jgi:succinate dehydrogenase / fumarate reductase membrane anchor subunit